MDGYGPSSYGDSFADVYDSWYGAVSDVDATVEGVATLAGGGPVLELGVGTGRLAIPLAARGLEVVGVDASAEMLDRLKAKDTAGSVRTVEADMADPGVASRHFALAFAAFNTFFNLTDDDAQSRCVASLARVLRPEGRVAIEAFVPPTDGMTEGGVSVRDITTTHLVLTASHHDPDGQVIHGQHVEMCDDGIRMRPWVLHYRTPPQLDALFESHGFVLERRHADWADTAFDAGAESHVSVYHRP